MNDVEKRIEQLERNQTLMFRMLLGMFPAIIVALTVATKSPAIGIFVTSVLLVGAGVMFATSKRKDFKC
jgi:hypothetical protein